LPGIVEIGLTSGFLEIYWMNKVVAAEEIKARVLRERGFFGDFHEAILKLDPRWLELYLEFGAAPVKMGAISDKLKHLIWIAVDCVPNHLYARGVKRHIELALKEGATVGEIFEVLELACELGRLTSETAMPIIVEELERAGKQVEKRPADPQIAKLKQEMIAARGEWPAWMDQMQDFGPDFVKAIANMTLEPWRNGVLPAKEKEFVYLAVFASPVTHDGPAIRRHVRRALELGATSAEVVEVVQLASMINFHTCTIGMPLLAEIADAETARQG
jgi:alkylhydroperoxidase/carboxymuconolactone decarboxylase family protein YurZ